MKHFGQTMLEQILKKRTNIPHAIGCTDAEIEAVMKAQGISKLPKAYREYLETMGKHGIMSWATHDSWSYESLLSFKDVLKGTYDDLEIEYDLPDDVFIIYKYLDTEFHYFRTNEDEFGYPIYMWTDRQNSDGRPYSIIRLTETLQDYFMRKAGLLKSFDNRTDNE